MTQDTLSATSSPTPDSYEAPQLQDLGTLAELTQGGAGDQLDGNGLMSSIGPT